MPSPGAAWRQRVRRRLVLSRASRPHDHGLHTFQKLIGWCASHTMPPSIGSVTRSRSCSAGQGLAPHLHALRSLCPHLHVRHLHRFHRHLLAQSMSPDPGETGGRVRIADHPVGRLDRMCRSGKRLRRLSIGVNTADSGSTGLFQFIPTSTVFLDTIPRSSLP